MPVPADPSPSPEVMPMSKPHVREAFHRQRGSMPHGQQTHADPQHDPRGRMPNDPDDQAAAADHPTGEQMTATAMPAPDPDDPNGALMTADLDEPIPDTLRMITPEDAARATLYGIVRSLGRDEVRVLTRIAARLQVGSRMYGPFYLATDTRVFRDTEARQELEDALVYLACAWLKAEAPEVTR
jgi:hypothetical protein